MPTRNGLRFCSDPIGGDGIIYDEDTEETWPTEHVMVTRRQTGEAEALILQAIEQKRQKGGDAYARGKTLVVFFDSDDPEWYPNKVGKQLPTQLLFAAVWVVGLQRATPDEYIYNVVSLDLSDGPAPVFYVRIPKDFDSWQVIRKQ